MESKYPLLRSLGLVAAALSLTLSTGCRSARRPQAQEAQAAASGHRPEPRDRSHQGGHESVLRGHHEGHHPHSGHQERRFLDPAEYVERWNSPERDRWQRPDEVLRAMGLAPGMEVADIGAGTGYFTAHLSRAVGPTGRVYAVDIETSMLDFLEATAREKGWNNLSTRLAEGGETGLEPASVDRMLIVNTWHHIPSRRTYARHLRECLREGGSVWIVDFLVDAPEGPPEKHRLPPQVVVEELEAGGLRGEIHPLALERQYLVVGRR